jgi:hypothetical protein
VCASTCFVASANDDLRNKSVRKPERKNKTKIFKKRTKVISENGTSTHHWITTLLCHRSRGAISRYKNHPSNMYGLCFFMFNFFVVELKNGTACKEEILQLVCESETEVLVIHRAVFDGQDSDGCGFLMPINISSLLPPVSSAIQQQPKNITDQEELQEMIELDSRRRLFSVQSTVNRR